MMQWEHDNQILKSQDANWSPLSVTIPTGSACQTSHAVGELSTTAWKRSISRLEKWQTITRYTWFFRAAALLLICWKPIADAALALLFLCLKLSDESALQRKLTCWKMWNMDYPWGSEESQFFRLLFPKFFTERNSTYKSVTWKRTCGFHMRINTAIKKRGRKVVIFCTQNHHNLVHMMTDTGNYLLVIYTYTLIFILFFHAIYWK